MFLSVFIFAIKPKIKSDIFTFQLMVLTVSIQYYIQNNNLRKPLENMQKLIFYFVVFVSFSNNWEKLLTMTKCSVKVCICEYTWTSL